MSRAKDPDYVPAGDGLDWIDRVDVRLCTDTTLPGPFVEQILAALKQYDCDSLRRIGNVLDRKASMLDLTLEQRETVRHDVRSTSASGQDGHLSCYAARTRSLEALTGSHDSETDFHAN